MPKVRSCFILKYISICLNSIFKNLMYCPAFKQSPLLCWKDTEENYLMNNRLNFHMIFLKAVVFELTFFVYHILFNSECTSFSTVHRKWRSVHQQKHAAYLDLGVRWYCQQQIHVLSHRINVWEMSMYFELRN